MSFLLRLVLSLAALLIALPAAAHPAPFSYLDLDVHDEHIDGTLTIHAIDAAHELGIADPETLFTPGVLAQRKAALEQILQPRLGLEAAGSIRWTGEATVADQDAVRLTFRIAGSPGSIALKPVLFRYDPVHQTFVNVYEDGDLRGQFIFAADSEPQTYYRGTTAGVLAVIGTFVPAGVHHILIGADHLLFLFGLILLGGGWRRLAIIVTAFTLGHSVTLSLAALQIVELPGSLIEPAIALSIVVVGVDNLLQRQGQGRDLRAGVAAVFGLVHGFGFASVLRDFGLPQDALGWSLFSFNVGVELGQLAVVLVVASVLALVRRRSPAALRQIETIGSIAVIAGGAYWFIERVFFGG